MIRRLSVTLTPEQVAYATRIGRQRYVSFSESIGTTPVRGGDQPHVQAAGAEMAVSVALKRPWDGSFQKVAEWRIWKRLERDVTVLRVRCAAFTTGGLVVYKADEDSTPLVLVFARDAPDYVIAGWLMGDDAKREVYWDEASASYVVPQTDLLACADLAREPERSGGGRRQDPAPDFGGNGKWPQMRYADDGGDPKKYGNVVTASNATPCCRCQTIIPKGALVGGSLVTGSIHGDLSQCRMKKRRR